MEKIYPSADQPQRQRESFQSRQTRAMEFSALGTYIQHRGGLKRYEEEVPGGELDGGKDAMTRLALDTVKSVKTDAENDRARGNEGCSLI